MILAEQDYHPAVSEADYRRFLRLPARRALTGPLAENAGWARAWFAAHARPWFFARLVGVAPVGEARVLLGSGSFDGAALVAPLADTDGAVVVAASAGPETDAESAARWAQGEPDRHFFLECYAAAVVEALVAEAGRRITAFADGRTVLPQHCPGFAGWPATEAARLLAVIRNGGALPGPIEALASGALRPKKSKLALFGIKRARSPFIP